MAHQIGTKHIFLKSNSVSFSNLVRLKQGHVECSLMKSFMKYLFTLLLSLCYLLPVAAQQLPLPKREFRGAWIQMINGQFMGMSRDVMQAN